MAYKKRFRKRGYRRPLRYSKTKKMITGSGPTYLEKIASGAGAVSRVARAVAPVIAAINTEAKYFDIETNGIAYNPGTNDSIIDLTQPIAQGVTDVTRIGNSILARNISTKIMLQFTPSVAGPLSGFARVILICWKENLQINAPTVAKLFEYPTLFTSAFNKDYTDQFVVLKDKVIPMNAMAAVATAQAAHFLKVFKKLEHHMRFDGAGTANGTQNHLFLIIRGSATVSSNPITWRQYSRLNFTDN